RRVGRGGVTVGPHAEQDQVQGRGRSLGIDLEAAGDGELIVPRRAIEIGILAAHPMHERRGGADLVEERGGGRAVIRVRMLGGNGALVTPEELHPPPVDRVPEGRRREQFIEAPGGRASRQGDGESAARVDGRRRQRDELRPGRLGKRRPVLERLEESHRATLARGSSSRTRPPSATSTNEAVPRKRPWSSTPGTARTDASRAALSAIGPVPQSRRTGPAFGTQPRPATVPRAEPRPRAAIHWCVRGTTKVLYECEGRQS